MSETNAKEFLQQLAEGNMIEFTNIAFSENEEAGLFGIVTLVGDAKIGVFPFRGSQEAIDFANFILKKVGN